MKRVPPDQQRALVDRLMDACGGAYSPEIRRKYYISGPQWAAAYQGQALFHAPTRQPLGFADVIREYGRLGISYWATHDTDVIPTEALGTDEQARIVGEIRSALKNHGVAWSMVNTGTFFHAVSGANPAAEAPEVREYAAWRIAHTGGIGAALGAQVAGGWPGWVGYVTLGGGWEAATLRCE